MGTTAEKLTYLNETKTQLKDMLNLGGASLTTEPFRQYVDTLKNRYLYYINNGTQEVWDNWEKVVGEGTTITLNNTEEAPMTIVLKGNTSQEGTPTPEAPQDIHVVSGDNSIVVSNGTQSASYPITLPEGMFLGWIPNTTYQDKIDKSSGKNLLDTSSMVLGDLNNTTGAEETNTNKTHYRSDFIPVKPNTTYVFTTDYQVTGINKLMEYGSNKSFIIRNSRSSTNKTIMFTTSANTYYFRLCMYTSPAFTDFYLLHNMLNEGTTALEYEPYGTGWYVKKEIGKVVLDGSENWFLWSTNVFAKNSISTIKSSVCSHFNFVTTETAGALKNGEYCWAGASNRYNVLMKNTNIETVADFKTWLSNNNTTIYYVLATPTYIEITDTTLINQLETIKKSYEGQTNISQTNNDLPFIINATALREMA